MSICRLKIWMMVLICSLGISIQGNAQNVSEAQRSFKRNTATVIFSSLGGGILGLSTLSFYGRPQEHTDNITMGVGLGLIAGMVYIFADSAAEARREVRDIWIPEPNLQQKIARNFKLEVTLFSIGFTY
ncbi:MAG: hypothetical protein AABY64_11615 [Bdellovibrionota bacterium]